MADIYYTGNRAAPYLEEYQRKLLEGAFQKTKTADPAGIAKQGIAGFQPFQTGAMAGTAGLYGYDPTTGLPTGTGAQYDPAFTKAQTSVDTGATSAAMGIPALQNAIKQFDPSASNYKQFFNQYQADVTKDALQQVDEQAAIQRNQLQDQAQQVGAFGGSRQAIQESELDKNILDIKSRRIFQDLATNFQQAQDKAIGTYESSAGRGLQGAGVFGQLGVNQAGLGSQGAGLAQQQFGLDQQGLGSLFQMGSQQQNQQQQVFNEQFRQDTLNRQEPYQRLSYFGDILKGIPSYQQTLQQKPTPYTNPLLGALGAGLGTYGILSGNTGDSSGAFSMFKRGGRVGN
tara:strand:- start:5051 stop:6079 length:1029 start_codon:yes stop_codon:yes gene_type:complete